MPQLPADVVASVQQTDRNVFTRDAARLYKHYCNMLAEGSLGVDLPRAALTQHPKYKAMRIHTPGHPAAGQYGLFAACKIGAGELILDYCGRVHTEAESDPTSDYDIRFVCVPSGAEMKAQARGDADLPHQSVEQLSIDAATVGNHGRFVNDFRGICARPNVEFKEYVDARGEVQMGVWALRHPIAKGTELCVTYGKGFWTARLGSEHDDADAL